jgi:hypothetical protein
MGKIIRLTESDLIKLVKRVIKEQVPESGYDFDKEEKERLSWKTKKNTPPIPERETPNQIRAREVYRIHLENIRDSIIPQLKEIFHNFNKINCEELNKLGLSGEYNRRGDVNDKTPEYAVIYCQFYQGKTRNDIHNMIKKYETQISSL